MVKIVSTLTYRQTMTVQGRQTTQTVVVQHQLDQMVPYLLPALITAGIYLLLRKAKLTPVWSIAVVVAVGLALGWPGWFAPGTP